MLPPAFWLKAARRLSITPRCSHPLGFQPMGLEDRSEIGSPRVSTRPRGFCAHCACLLAWDYATIAAKLCATTFGSGQCVFGALANHPPLFLGHHRHDANREPVGVWHVSSKKSTPAFSSPSRK